MSRRLHTVQCLAASMIAALLLACAGTGGGRGAHPASIDAAGAPGPFAQPMVGGEAGQSSTVEQGLELRAFLLANRARRQAGRPALVQRPDLIRLARLHARDMAERDFFSHYNPEGDGPADRARARWVAFSAFAENLARVRYSDDPAGVAVEGWLQSPGHRRNLLDETGANYHFTGVGVVRREDGTVLLSQVFLR